MRTIPETLNREINYLLPFTRFNKSRIMRRARVILLNNVVSWSEALKMSWAEAKQVVNSTKEEITEIVERLANAYCPRLISTERSQDILNVVMLTAYLQGSKIN